MFYILQTRHVLVLYFPFVIAVMHADFKSDGKGRGLGGRRFLLLYSKLNLKSWPAIMHFSVLFYLLFYWLSLTKFGEGWNFSLLKKMIVISDLCGIDELL